MKHTIRQRVLDPVTGLMVTKVETVNGELGSGLYDRNSKELFEGDIVSVLEHKHPFTVTFEDGKFWMDNGRMKCYLTYFRESKLEVIGHVDD